LASGKEETTPAELVGAAAEALRPRELEEFGPAFRDTLTVALADSEFRGEVRLDRTAPIADWNRPTTEVDLAVADDLELTLVAGLKVWDIGYQLLEVAKVCCLLKAGARAGFLLCIAEADAYDREPGGELFRERAGLEHGDVFPILFQRHPAETRKHLNVSRQCPISLPRRFSTTAVCDPVELDAHPGHELRVVEVRIEDPTPTPIPSELIAED
jgi:hypothetical protein